MAELQKSIGPWRLVAVGAAGVIGSSYLYLSSALFDAFSFGSVVVGMLLATLLASGVAIGIGELASMFPRAGGEFVYSYVGFGRFPAFLVGWLLISTYTGIVGFYVTATGRLLSSVIPSLETIPLYDIGGGQVYLPVLAVGLILVLGTLVVNWFGAQLSFGLQLVLFIALVAIGLILVVVAFAEGDYQNTQPFFGGMNVGEGLISSASFMVTALGFLTGFSVVAVMAEEANVSHKRLGSLIVASVVIAGVFYALIFYVTGWMIPWQETAKMTNGTIEVFQVTGHTTLAFFAFIAGVIGILTTVIAVFASASRLIFSLARVGLLPVIFAKVDKKTGVPKPALLLTAGMGLLVGLIGPDAIEWMLNVGGMWVAAVWVMTVLVFYTIRRRYPQVHRPYRVSRFATVAPMLGGIAGAVLVTLTVIPGTPLSFTSIFEYLNIVLYLGIGAVLYVLAPKPTNRDETMVSLLGEEQARELTRIQTPKS